MFYPTQLKYSNQISQIQTVRAKKHPQIDEKKPSISTQRVKDAEQNKLFLSANLLRQKVFPIVSLRKLFRIVRSYWFSLDDTYKKFLFSKRTLSRLDKHELFFSISKTRLKVSPSFITAHLDKNDIFLSLHIA